MSPRRKFNERERLLLAVIVGAAVLTVVAIIATAIS